MLALFRIARARSANWFSLLVKTVKKKNAHTHNAGIFTCATFFLLVLYCWCCFCCCHLKLAAAVVSVAVVVGAAREQVCALAIRILHLGPKTNLKRLAAVPAEWQQQQISTAFSCWFCCCCLFFWAKRDAAGPQNSRTQTHTTDTHGHKYRENNKNAFAAFAFLCFTLLLVCCCCCCYCFCRGEPVFVFALHFVFVSFGCCCNTWQQSEIDYFSAKQIEILLDIISALVALGAFGMRMHRYSVLHLLPVCTPTHWTLLCYCRFTRTRFGR